MIEEHDTRCSGCTACMAACPEEAISMRPDEEGFLFPVINREKCTGCGTCDSVCQIRHARKNAWRDHCYAARNADEKALAFSSSGAVFPVLADYALALGGHVCGCVMDDDFTVHHMISQKPADVRRMCKSKYVQSDIGDCLRQVKALLDAGEFVLFTGTPCQVGGLINFLGRNYDNLLTMDVICHGTPSPFLFKHYTEAMSSRYDIKAFWFRDKIKGWRKSVRMTWLDRDGQRIDTYDCMDDLYVRSFLLNCCLRHSCGTCAYATPQRASDITVCDFWRIAAVLPALRVDKGVSGLMVNTDKGECVVHGLRDRFAVLARLPFDSLIGNGPLIHPIRIAAGRDGFYRNHLMKESFMQALDNEMFPVGILNFSAIDNYGSLLVGVALCSAIKRMGYRPEMINLSGGRKGDRKQESKLQQYRDAHLPMSPPVYTYSQCAQLNTRYRTIVTGSDAIWSELFTTTELGMLAWARGRKTLISYAPSFFETELSGAITEEAAGLMLRRLDAVSVREDTGVELCRRLGVTARQLPDAVMLLTVKDLENIIEQDGDLHTPDEEYIAFYILNPHTKQLCSSKITGTTIDARYDNNKSPHSLGQFLDYIRKAKLVITSSYHGLLLSILFNKAFLIVKPNSGSTRLESLLRMVGVNKRFHEPRSLTTETLVREPQPDYAVVNERIRKLREEALVWLREALAIPPSEKPEFLSSLVQEQGLDRSENREKLYAWADEQLFDPSCKTPDKTPFALAAYHSLAFVPSPRIPGEASEITRARDLAYALQLAEAHRVLDPQTFAIIEADTTYQKDPRLLAAVIAQFKRDSHLQYLLREADRLKGQPVYFYCCTRMYRLRRYLFRESIPRAILVDWGPIGQTINGLPVRHPNDISQEDALPVIIFHEKAINIVSRLQLMHPHFTDIVCCAMY